LGVLFDLVGFFSREKGQEMSDNYKFIEARTMEPGDKEKQYFAVVKDRYGNTVKRYKINKQDIPAWKEKGFRYED
jgi:hypothetical protein